MGLVTSCACGHGNGGLVGTQKVEGHQNVQTRFEEIVKSATCAYNGAAVSYM